MDLLEVRDVEDVIVVSFKHTEILDQVVIEQIGDQFRDLPTQAASCGRLLINFDGIEFMASAMIGQILMLHKQCVKDKIHLKLCGISPNILEVFKITTLDKLLDIRPNELKAIQAFGPGRQPWHR